MIHDFPNPLHFAVKEGEPLEPKQDDLVKPKQPKAFWVQTPIQMPKEMRKSSLVKKSDNEPIFYDNIEMLKMLEEKESRTISDVINAAQKKSTEKVEAKTEKKAEAKVEEKKEVKKEEKKEEKHE